MNTLPEDIQDTIYRYKHQMEFEVVMWELINELSYCEWCGKNVRFGFECDCVDKCIICGSELISDYPTKMCVCMICDRSQQWVEVDW